jgi:hypothetical protein
VFAVVPVSAHTCSISGQEGFFYEDINHGGAAYHVCYGESIPNLGVDGWNDRISSYSITLATGRGMIMYEDINSGGASLKVCGTSSRNSMPTGWNDRVSSIKSTTNCPV